jgi:CheY-like chemotaxis protein
MESPVRRRVLMIDDDADIREVAALSVETMGGWEMLQAATGEEGIAKAELERPDAILLDLMMPDVDGRATLKRLKDNEKTAKIPVVLLTAKSQGMSLEELKELGLADFLPKPFDPVTLCNDISRVLGWEHE